MDLDLKDDVIKCYVIGDIVNINTTETIGFVFDVTLNKKYSFGLDLINLIQNKLKPAKTKIEYYDNNLHLKFKYYN